MFIKLCQEVPYIQMGSDIDEFTSVKMMKRQMSKDSIASPLANVRLLFTHEYAALNVLVTQGGTN